MEDDEGCIRSSGSKMFLVLLPDPWKIGLQFLDVQRIFLKKHPEEGILKLSHDEWICFTNVRENMDGPTVKSWFCDLLGHFSPYDKPR